MDNFRVDVVSDRLDDLYAAIKMLVDHSPGKKVTHFMDMPAITGAQAGPSYDLSQQPRPRTLVFYWHESSKGIALPTPLNAESAADMAKLWLGNLRVEDYAGQIDMDGDCLPKAVRVFNEGWGRVFGNHYGVAGIQGRYAWYGK